MPQLDVVSFFNQIAWLTAAFLALLPLFYMLVSTPYSQTMAARGPLSRSLALITPSAASAPAGPSSGQPSQQVAPNEAGPSRSRLSAFRARAYSALR